MQPHLDQPYASLAEPDKEENRAAGWTFGSKRDDAAKRHPSMIPYADLPETEKEKDRGNIRHYPAFAARAGLCITSAA
jgi:hypothetical protein